jgi:peptide-methionine (S)-S-oxide reductase
MGKRIGSFLIAGILSLTTGAAAGAAEEAGMSAASASNTKREVITLGGGCFWCLEAVFDELLGVEGVESGYSGGSVSDPTYEEVCAGTSGHAEVVQITFDPAAIGLADLLRIFFTVHDPTTLNRQGADHGTQYRSVILFRTPEQKQVAEQVIREVTAAKIWDDPIVTQLAAFESFYEAENYHQGYFAANPRQPYCQIVIAPKVAKFREQFRNRLKKSP